MSNENEIEIKCVFGLLDPANTKEVHIQQINNLINSFDTTVEARRRSKTALEKPTEETTAVKAKPKLLQAGDKRSSGFVISSQKQFGKRNSLKKSTNDSHLTLLENPEKLLRGGESKSAMAAENNNEANDADADYTEFALKSFPNKKKTMNYNEFTDVYENVFHNNSIQDDILLKCFSMFDTEKQGYLNAKAVQKVFELFNEKVTESDVENLLKFVGCSSGKMTFQEFKDFFKKNL